MFDVFEERINREIGADSVGFVVMQVTVGIDDDPEVWRASAFRKKNDVPLGKGGSDRHTLRFCNVSGRQFG